MKSIKHVCPKCKGPLQIEESESLWCPKGCYESEYALWEALQKLQPKEHKEKKRLQGGKDEKAGSSK